MYVTNAPEGAVGVSNVARASNGFITPIEPPMTIVRDIGAVLLSLRSSTFTTDSNVVLGPRSTCGDATGDSEVGSSITMFAVTAPRTHHVFCDVSSRTWTVVTGPPV